MAEHSKHMPVPERLPFDVTPLTAESRLRLITTLLGSIANHDSTLSIDKVLLTAHTCVEHFEMVSSAIEAGFITSYDDAMLINGYPLRIYMPARQTGSLSDEQ